MQIVLWSNEAGGSGSTCLASILASMIAANHNYKTFITHTMTGDITMEGYLLKPSERELSGYIGESNTDGLFRLIKNGKLTKDMVKDYSFSLLSHSNLDFLNIRKSYVADESFILNYTYLLYLARQFYDVCVVDLNVGIDHPLFSKVLKDADVFIVVGSQNKARLEELVDTLQSYRESFREVTCKTLFAINKYDLNTTIPLKVLKGPIKAKKIYTIPYQTEISDSCNRSELVDFLLRQCQSKRKNTMDKFMGQVNALVSDVLKLYEEVKKDAV